MRRSALTTMTAILLVLAACGGGDDAGAEDSTTTAPPAETTTTAAETSTTAETETTSTAAETTSTSEAETMDGVHVAESALGEILVDADGFTLYVFTNDSGGESTCYDQCADNWPPVDADTAISSDLDDSLFSATTRSDGTEQLTVNGQPLYRYAADTAPGDTNGHGVGDVWFAVGIDGSMLEVSATQGTIADDYGYDY